MTGMATGPRQQKIEKGARPPAFAPGWHSFLAAMLVAACGAQAHGAPVSALATATVVAPVAITTRVGLTSPFSGGMTRVIVVNAAYGSASAARPQPDTAVVTVVSDGHTYSVTAIATEVGQTIEAQTLFPAPGALAGTVLARGMMAGSLTYGGGAGRGDIRVVIEYN